MASADLVVLDEGVGQERLAHLGKAVGLVHFELDQPSHPHVAHALEAERRKRALDGLALGVQDPLLRPDQDAEPQRSSQAANGSPARRS